MKVSEFADKTKSITLYHGSKSGIQEKIAPKSRKHCDFGKGFYMGTEKSQPLTLICNYPSAILYTLNVDLSDLKILDLKLDLDWALFVAYNRGKMDTVKGSKLYSKYAKLSKGFDIINGYIANDRMFIVLDRFFNGTIILDKQSLSENEREYLKQESTLNRFKGISLAEEICRKYRREGRFFDEILNMEN